MIEFQSTFSSVSLPYIMHTVQPYLYRGFPALSLNHSTIYTRSSRVVGSMSHGNVTLRPNTASTPIVLTATSSKNMHIRQTGLCHVCPNYIFIQWLVGDLCSFSWMSLFFGLFLDLQFVMQREFQRYKFMSFASDQIIDKALFIVPWYSRNNSHCCLVVKVAFSNKPLKCQTWLLVNVS
jgi:hypothetical protein